jgi:UDP-GlcNAc:undecaprenyl-phosphate GlcNAc-1-phosphate transferase
MIYIYEYIISFMIAFGVAVLTTPLVKKIAFKMGAIDFPEDDRRMHKEPIAKLGGLAIVFGFLAALLFIYVGSFFDLYKSFKPDRQLLGFLAGIVIIVVMGVIDDVKNLRARYKLIFQLAAAIVIVLMGTRIQYVTNPFSDIGFSELSPLISYPLTIVWIMGITNALNLIDGLDGLAAGVSSIASISLIFISVIMQRWDTAILTAALAGSTLGFLPYNLNPAKIFMSDTGSNFLGFVLGVISVQGTIKSYAAVAIAVPLLVLGLPLFDTLFAIARRVVSGKPIMGADRGHLHHRLIDLGLSQKQAVLIMYIVSATLGICAVLLAGKGAIAAIILVISATIFVIGGASYMREIKSEGDLEENHEKDNSSIL